MEKAREILSKKVEIKNGEIHCFVDVVLQAMEDYANRNTITAEMIFDRAIKIHNTTKGKGFIEGADWAIKQLTKK